MRNIRTITRLFSVSILLFSMAGCAGGKDAGYSFVQDPPFTLGTVYYQDWVAGVKEGGSGTNVHINVESYSDDVVFLNIYFGNKKAEAKNVPQGSDQFIGYFKNEGRPDIVMDGDPLKEAANIPPEPIPFQLKEDEAVLSYLVKDEVKYLKLSNMEEKPMIAYPSTNNNGTDEN